MQLKSLEVLVRVDWKEQYEKAVDGYDFIRLVPVETAIGQLLRCKDCPHNDGGFCDDIMEGKAVDDDWFCKGGLVHDKTGA